MKRPTKRGKATPKGERSQHYIGLWRRVWFPRYGWREPMSDVRYLWRGQWSDITRRIPATSA